MFPMGFAAHQSDTELLINPGTQVWVNLSTPVWANPGTPGMGSVIPAQAGIQFLSPTTHVGWILAFAGMTKLFAGMTLSDTVCHSELENPDDTRGVVRMSSACRQVQLLDLHRLTNA